MYLENASCPGSLFDCSNGSYPLGANRLLAIPAILSSTLSCIGAVIIVFTYCRWKDIRTGSRAIITYLSIADFFTAFGYVLGSLNYSINYSNTQARGCIIFTYFCQIQSFITTSSSMSSFLWTSSLAIYLYLALVRNKVVFVQKLFPFFHVFNWVVPIIISFPLLVTGHLGYSYYAVSTWCYIGFHKENFAGEEKLLVMVAGKFWEILSYVVVIVLYFLIKRHISVQAKKGLDSKFLNSGLIAILRRSDKKLIAIPMVFVLLRIWGTLGYMYTLAVSNYIHDGCTTGALAAGSTVLAILQAIGDGGQGWGNFILYVMVSERIRQKLLTCYRSRQPDTHPPNLQEKTSSFLAPRDCGINYGTVKESTPIKSLETPPIKSPVNKITRGMEIESYEPTTG